MSSTAAPKPQPKADTGRARELKLTVLDETFVNFSWTIWHETVRSFNDSYPGAVRDINTIRAEAIAAQSHNPHAQDLIRAATNNELLLMVDQTRSRVYSEFHLVLNFDWVAYHENQLAQLRTLLSERKFIDIRALYEARQDHNPNTRHLLNAVSDLDIEVII